MADQNYIQQLSDDLSFRVGEMQSEVIGSVLGMVEGKTNLEAIRIINDLNVLNIITLKSQSILSEFQSGLVKILEKYGIVGPIAVSATAAALRDDDGST